MDEQIFSNARVVTAAAVLQGHVVADGGHIRIVDRGALGAASALDLEGDFLLPGLVELHTDHLERHVAPRPGVRWPMPAALMAHDAQIAGAGITTVFDALTIGDWDEGGLRAGMYREAIAAVGALADGGATRAEHLLHLRCEVALGGTAAELDQLIDNPRVRLVSLMDHTPGQRQFVNIDKYYEYNQGKYGYTDAQMARFIGERTAAQQRHAKDQRAHAVAACATRGMIMASHDDATVAHIEEAVAHGVSIAEFPTTLEAAAAAREHGMTTIAGAPNLVRGQSHSGNIAAIDLAREGLLDALSSDYVPASLLQAAFALRERIDLPLPAAIATVSRNPARMVGLEDRGEIAEGRRADLIRVRLIDGLPVVRGVWREGRRVA